MNIKYPNERLYRILCVSTNNSKIIHQIISKKYFDEFSENFNTIDAIYNIRYNDCETFTTVGPLYLSKIEHVYEVKEITEEELQSIELAVIMNSIYEEVYDKKIEVDLSQYTSYDKVADCLEQNFKNDNNMKWEI